MAEAKSQPSMGHSLEIEQQRLLAGIYTIARIRADVAGAQSVSARPSHQANLDNVPSPAATFKPVAQRIGAITENRPIVAAWDNTVKPQIHEILKGSPKLRWNLICVVRVGCSPETASPMPVTVIIAMDHDIEPREWVVAEGRIRKLLDEHGFQDVNVSLEHGGFCDLSLFD